MEKMRRKMKIPIAIYPYCQELFSIVKYFDELQREYKLVSLISPEGYGLKGKDASFVNNYPNINIKVHSDVDEDMDKWEILLVVEVMQENLEVYNQKLELISKVLENNKKVFYFPKNIYDIKEEITIFEQKHRDNFLILGKEVEKEIINLEDVKNQTFDKNKITAPIFFIGGLLEQTDVTEIVFKIISYMIMKGKKILGYINSPMYSFLGLESIKPIFDNKAFSEKEKIDVLQYVISKRDSTNYPDFIIIEAPDPIMQYNTMIPNGYGIYTYMLTRVVDIDYFIACIPYKFLEKKFIDLIRKDWYIRLGCDIDIIHASNIVIDTTDSFERKEISIFYENMDSVNKKISQIKLERVFNIVCEDMEKVIDVLRNNNFV